MGTPGKLFFVRPLVRALPMSTAMKDGVSEAAILFRDGWEGVVRGEMGLGTVAIVDLCTINARTKAGEPGFALTH